MSEVIAICRPNCGETWDMVAHREMGDEYYMQDLMDANPAYHGIVIFEGNEILNIPDVSEQDFSLQAPWRRNE